MLSSPADSVEVNCCIIFAGVSLHYLQSELCALYIVDRSSKTITVIFYCGMHCLWSMGQSSTEHNQMAVSMYFEKKEICRKLLALEPVSMVIRKSRLRLFGRAECKGDTDWIKRYTVIIQL